MNYLGRLIIATFLLHTAFCISAYNMRQTSNADGLTNSAILAMHQDPQGFLWLGTCDGVNIFEGNTAIPFHEMYPGLRLSGNIIESILSPGDGVMWVHTNHGLDRVDTRNNTIDVFSQFQGAECVRSNPEGDIFVLAEDRNVYIYNADGEPSFDKLFTIDQSYFSVKEMAVGSNCVIMATDEGVIRYWLKRDDNGLYSMTGMEKLSSEPIIFAQNNDSERMHLLTQKGDLLRLKLDGSMRRLLNIKPLIDRHGEVSNIVRDRKKNLFIAFRTDGVTKISGGKDGRYSFDDLGLRVGVFCLEYSEDQDVVWIGTDCQGVYTYSEGAYNIRTLDFASLGGDLSHPVRTILLDRDSTLWVGTKGDGLLRIPNFDERQGGMPVRNQRLFTSGNSGLLHNFVFGICESSRPILWISTEGGINYYSYADGAIHAAQISEPVKFVHDIYEEGDSVLWMATIGEGVVKARISGSPSAPVLTDIRHYTVDNNNFASNYFFALSTDKDGRLLLGNRGMGVFVLENDHLRSIPIKGDYGTETINDAFAVMRNDSILWVGTGHGLVKIDADGNETYFGPEKGLVNSTIHDMLSDNSGNVWVSTNQGLVKVDPLTDESQLYAGNYGVSITEFSDGAAFRTANSLFFGGIDGIAIVSRNKNYDATAVFDPELVLARLAVSGQFVSLPDYLRSKGGHNRISLAHDQNHFAVTFMAPDYQNAANYTYYYTLDGKEWISNGSRSTISFNEMDYGNYTLGVKYVNRTTGSESEPYVLDINIRAPWYLSNYAKVVYVLLLLAIGLFSGRRYVREQRRRQREELHRMEQVHREEVYEEKLKFFTNITHEFCTPLTLIYGPCERILSYSGSDDYIRKYVGLVRLNAERLNNLIQELIDFRRVETGHKTLKVQHIGISGICNDIAESFSELADRNNVDLRNNVPDGLTWNTDYNCLRKVLTNLVSNAFKYTPVGGCVEQGAEIVDGKLRLWVYNTGKGIREEDKERIFNRYSILDNVEENAIKGLSARNGLGMAICHSMVEVLQGTIEIESEVGKYARFVVTLPLLEVNAEGDAIIRNSADCTVSSAAAEIIESAPKVEIDVKGRVNGRHNILIIDDNPEILTLLSDSLTEFNIETASSAAEGLDILTKRSPDLVITDVMMPGTNGFELTRQIKQNKHTMHIPLIILSAKSSDREQIQGIESGADVYIGKPFNLSYLKAVIQRLIDSRDKLREYYNTSASAYEFTNGKLLNKEDKDFMAKVTEYIDANIDDTELSPEQLAQHLQTSVRNLYRKFKDLDQLPPNDFIKSHRISYAAKLLITTTLTVQEVLYKSGFTNRSHFYKEFDKRFGMTPKDYRMSNRVKDTTFSTEVRQDD